jgi:hypothetical protein
MNTFCLIFIFVCACSEQLKSPEMTAKMSVLGESLSGDQERDANTLLLELDKGTETILSHK